MSALNPTDAVAGCLSPRSSCYLLNYSMPFQSSWACLNSTNCTYTEWKAFRLALKHKDYTFDGTAQQQFMRLHNNWQSICSQTCDIWSYRPELGNRFYIFRWGSAPFPCPLIDPILQQQGCPLLQHLYLGVLCSLFDVQYRVLDCYYQLSKLRSPIPLSSVSEGDRIDASSFLSLPIITGGKGGWALGGGVDRRNVMFS